MLRVHLSHSVVVKQATMLQSIYQGRQVLRLQAANILTITENETMWLLYLRFESSTLVFVIFQFSLVFLCCIRRFRSQNLLAFVCRTSTLFCVLELKGLLQFHVWDRIIYVTGFEGPNSRGLIWWTCGSGCSELSYIRIHLLLLLLSWTTFEFHVFNVSFQAINRRVTIFQLGHLYLIPTHFELIIVTCHHQLLKLLSNLFGFGFRWFYFSNHLV